MLNKKTSPI